jgi:hypothetical protein
MDRIVNLKIVDFQVYEVWMAARGKRMRKSSIIQYAMDAMDKPEVVGNRLYKIRYVANFGGDKQQKTYAEMLLLPEKSYSHWEIGRAMIPVHAAIVICDWTEAVTLDYVYRGRLDFVAPAWGLALKAAPDRPK